MAPSLRRGKLIVVGAIIVRNERQVLLVVFKVGKFAQAFVNGLINQGRALGMSY